jgi:hypothetical protein
VAKEDLVDVQICNVPKKLLAEFDSVVGAKNFPGGHAEAFRDLMAKPSANTRLPWEALKLE